MGISVLPYKTDSPPVIYPATVLSGSISLKFLKPVSGRNPQGLKLAGSSEHFKLPGRQALNIAREATAKSALIDLLGSPALKGFDHSKILASLVSIVNR